MEAACINRRSWEGFSSAALAAFFFATMPVAARLIYAQSGVDPLVLLAVRFSTGAPFPWLFRGHGDPVLPLRCECPWLALALGGLVATSVAYYSALRVIPAAMAIRDPGGVVDGRPAARWSSSVYWG